MPSCFGVAVRRLWLLLELTSPISVDMKLAAGELLAIAATGREVGWISAAIALLDGMLSDLVELAGYVSFLIPLCFQETVSSNR